MLHRILFTACVLGAAAPSLAQTHFHHAHLNSTDPAAAIEFYTTHLSGEKATFGGKPTRCGRRSRGCCSTR